MEELEAVAGSHLAVIGVRRALAHYDSDVYEALKWTDRLLEVSPNDTAFLFAKLNLLEQLARRQERLVLLDDISRRPETASPAFWLTLAGELSRDARATDGVRSLLRYTFRYQPNSGPAIGLLGALLWKEGHRDKAYDLYRFAACLQGRDEHASASYFAVARSLNRKDESLQFLIDRFHRFGRKSASPAITLAQAYEAMSQGQLAMETVREAFELLPDDADLQMFAAFLYAQHGQVEELRKRLLRAKSCTRRPVWLRQAAELAAMDHAPEAALARCREVLEWEPMAVDVHQQVAVLLAELEGVDAALTHLRIACRRFPRYMGLSRLLLEWVKYEGPEAVEGVGDISWIFSP